MSAQIASLKSAVLNMGRFILTMQYASGSHVGKVRSTNEDSYFADSDLGLWLVADGMGGHNAGDVASALVVAAVSDHYRRHRDLAAALQHAHKAVKEAARTNPAHAGMGSTAVALAVTGDRYELAWVGDSRGYLWDNQLKQLTRDHSVVLDLLDRGLITIDQVSNHPCENMITQALGLAELEAVEVDILSGTLQGRQCLLLCSDGLNNEVPDELIAAIMADNKVNEEIVNDLIDKALINGGKDNVTVILITATGERR